jgi:gliding motility-associated lipoprotein GldH
MHILSLNKKKPSTYYCIIVVLLCSLLAACNAPSLDVFEKHVAFNQQRWASQEIKNVRFTITDTTSLYTLYLVFRHTDAYGFNNVWLKINRKGPDTSYAQQLDIRLATNEKGWLGTGMDDVWEHRTLLTAIPVQFHRTGLYEFDLQQIMRQDPLEHVLNIGLRVEKTKPQ